MKPKNLDYSECIKDGKTHLCYVDDNDDGLIEAYFSEIPARFNWGDDWGDAPYEHNAGCPYHEYTTDEMEGDKHKYFPVEITKIIIEPKWYTSTQFPRSGTLNSKWTVEDINNKLVPWIIVNTKDDMKFPIWADATMEEVIEKCKAADMKIYKQI